MRNPSHTRPRPACLPALIAATAAVAALASTTAAAVDPPSSPASLTASAAKPATNPAPAVAATNVVYKWKDAHGVSQYSQQPPPKGVKFEIIGNSGTAGGGQAADAGSASLRQN